MTTISSDLVRAQSFITLTPSDYDISGFFGVAVFLFERPIPFDRVRSSLSRVLLEFPQLAGRLKNLYDFPSRGCIELNNKGVSLERAESKDCTVDQIVHTRDFKDLVPQIDKHTDHLFLVKYTSLACGGVALSTAGNHSVMDACAYWSFIDSWARLSRGEALREGFVLDRTPLMPREPLQFQAHSVIPESANGAAAAAGDVDEPTAAKPVPPAPVVAIVSFTPDELEKLKSSSGQKLTTFECLAGHLWKCAATHSLRPEVHKNTSAAVMVNARRLLSVPRCFFGNALELVFPGSELQDIVDNPWSYAAKVIHDALRSVDAQETQTSFDKWEHFWRQGKDAWEEFRNEQIRGIVHNRSRFSINSWAGFPMYECDFGTGTPALVSIAHKLDDQTIFIQPAAGGGLEVHISLQQEYLDAVVSHVKVLGV